MICICGDAGVSDPNADEGSLSVFAQSFIARIWINYHSPFRGWIDGLTLSLCLAVLELFASLFAFEFVNLSRSETVYDMLMYMYNKKD